MAKIYGGAMIPKQVRKNPGDLLTIGDLADAVAYPGEDKKAVTDRLRWYMRQGQLTPIAQETEGKRAFLFLPGEILVAEVLVRLNQFGISGNGAAQAVAMAFNFWRDGDAPDNKYPAITPGQHVIREYEGGSRDWVFDLWLFATPTGEKLFQGRFMSRPTAEGTNVTHPGPQYEARAVLSVPMTDILDRVHPSRRAARNAAN